MSKHDQVFQLKFGRNLGFAEFGDLNGNPLFFFHGWPSTRMHGACVDSLAKKLGIRVISPDRPGVGLSDFQEGRTLLDFPDDIIELADSLNLKKFGVAGVSGGGPYAAVCAYKIPTRFLKTAIIVGLAPTYIPGICKGMAPLNTLTWESYGRIPFARELAGGIVYLKSKLESLSIVDFPARQDRNVMNSEFKKRLEHNMAEAVRNGTQGIVQDLYLYTTEWGFDSSEIASKVNLYYGKHDKNVSLKMGKYYRDHIRSSTLKVYDGGHLGWMELGEEILKSIKL